MCKVCTANCGEKTNRTTQERKKEERRDETRETIPILIIHNLVRQFQFPFVLFLFHVFSLSSHSLAGSSTCARRVMNHTEPAEERTKLRCSLYFICTYVKTYTILCGGSTPCLPPPSPFSLCFLQFFLAVVSSCIIKCNIKLNYHIFTAEINYECNFSHTK